MSLFSSDLQKLSPDVMGGSHLLAWLDHQMDKVELKTELISLEDFNTHAQAQTVVFESIVVFANRQRCHAANGYLAPLAYEQALKANGTLCLEKC
jgi:hypothetical protein